MCINEKNDPFGQLINSKIYLVNDVINDCITIDYCNNYYNNRRFILYSISKGLPVQQAQPVQQTASQIGNQQLPQGYPIGSQNAPQPVVPTTQSKFNVGDWVTCQCNIPGGCTIKNSGPYQITAIDYQANLFFTNGPVTGQLDDPNYVLANGGLSQAAQQSIPGAMISLRKAMDEDIKRIMKDSKPIYVTNKQKCTCDFVTVVLPYGCKCGGE